MLSPRNTSGQPAGNLTASCQLPGERCEHVQRECCGQQLAVRSPHLRPQLPRPDPVPSSYRELRAQDQRLLYYPNCSINSNRGFLLLIQLAASARRKIRFALNLLYNEWNESITDFPLKNVGRLFEIGLVHGCGLIAFIGTNFILKIKIILFLSLHY